MRRKQERQGEERANEDDVGLAPNEGEEIRKENRTDKKMRRKSYSHSYSKGERGKQRQRKMERG